MDIKNLSRRAYEIKDSVDNAIKRAVTDALYRENASAAETKEVEALCRYTGATYSVSMGFNVHKKFLGDER